MQQFNHCEKILYPVDEQILWLEVSVKNVAAVAEGESFQQLVHERLQNNKQLSNTIQMYVLWHASHCNSVFQIPDIKKLSLVLKSSNLDDLRIQVTVAAVKIFLQILWDGKKHITVIQKCWVWWVLDADWSEARTVVNYSNTLVNCCGGRGINHVTDYFPITTRPHMPLLCYQ